MADPIISRAILAIDSPGGSAMGVEELADDIERFGRSKPIVSFVDGLCCSAAFWLGCATSNIVATPSSEVGSIGVYSLHLSLAGALEKSGVAPTFTVSKASPRKIDGNPYQELSDEAKANEQAAVDRIAARFVNAVARGRAVDPARVRSDYGQGATIDARAAKARGMIDGVGDFATALTASPITPARRAAEARHTIIAAELAIVAVQERRRKTLADEVAEQAAWEARHR